MKATVYYIRLSDADVAELNAQGWDSPIGNAYTDARAGVVDDGNRGLFEQAAVVEAETAEAVWMRLQNIDGSWTSTPGDGKLSSVHTDFPRSMDVGDLIVWDDGRVERVASVGFEDAGWTPAGD